ncbi:MAG: PKD domain-containing protein [Chitinophagaceae bacterium]
MKKNLITRTLLVAATITPFFSCKKDAGRGNGLNQPVADFEFTITDPNASPIEVVFTNKSKNATTFRWDMGDGAESLSEHPKHLYVNGGAKKVQLIAGNSFGRDTIIKTINVGAEETSPLTWQEDWGKHVELLTRVYYSKNTVVYYDKNMNKDLVWPFAFLDTVWGYVKANYGAFGKNLGQDDRLYGVFHTSNSDYNGGHPAAYFDDHHHYRNVLDCGTGNGLTAWAEDWGWNTGVLVHEIGHIVEGASKGVKESPAFDIWGDSKWAEIFAYDVFKGIGRTRDMRDTYNECIDKADPFPTVGSWWFKDWYLPIYEQYGGVTVLNKFFDLLAAHFPKAPYQNLKMYTRRMNFGEYIHYMSAAAGANLQPLVTKAFGWKTEWTTMLSNAKMSYPGLTYPGINDALVNTNPDMDITTQISAVAVSKENEQGAGSTYGSSRLTDKNAKSWFASEGFTPGYTITLTLPSAQIVDSYTLGTGDNGGKDLKEWKFQGSNDMNAWQTLDEQEDRNFYDREREYRFRFQNNTGYKYYRLLIQAIDGNTELQLSEIGLWKTK